MSETREFVYLLNALEDSAQQDQPSAHGYPAKRMAVLDYVAELRAVLSALGAVKGPEGWTVPNPCPAEHIPGRFGGWLCQGEFGCNGKPRIPVRLTAPEAPAKETK